MIFQLQITPPPQKNWNLGISWHFVIFQLQITPPPPKNWNLGISWHFVIFQLQITPPQKNWNLGISWHFVIFQLQITPPPPRKLKFRHILALCDFSVADYPPPPENWNLGISWHFVIFQLQITPPPTHPKIWNYGRSSQWESMCGKLPHVETLSNPDNYSFCHALTLLFPNCQFANFCPLTRIHVNT